LWSHDLRRLLGQRAPLFAARPSPFSSLGAMNSRPLHRSFDRVCSSRAD
jgi:hypothetical protein